MNYGLVVAAGAGTRFGGRKQFALLKGKPILYYSLRAFECCPAVKEVVLVTNADMIDRTEVMTKRWRFGKTKWIVAGGEQRQDSVAQGLRVLPDRGMVAIHDGVRPFLTPEQIARGFRECRRRKAVIFGVPISETVKSVRFEASPKSKIQNPKSKIQRAGVVMRTIPREHLILAQTPQFYDLTVIKRAYDQARQDGYYATDDAQLVERLRLGVAVLDGWPENVKVTTRADLEVAGRLPHSALRTTL